MQSEIAWEDAMLDEPHNTKLTCVLADDAAVMRDVTRMLLSSLGWVEIRGEAANGVEAFERIVELRPDMAMLDMRMPGLTGFAVAERVRELDIPTSIIVFSAFASEENADEAASLGVEFVSKVDGVPALLAALERIRSTHAVRCA